MHQMVGLFTSIPPGAGFASMDLLVGMILDDLMRT